MGRKGLKKSSSKRRAGTDHWGQDLAVSQMSLTHFAPVMDRLTMPSLCGRKAFYFRKSTRLSSLGFFGFAYITCGEQTGIRELSPELESDCWEEQEIFKTGGRGDLPEKDRARVVTILEYIFLMNTITCYLVKWGDGWPHDVITPWHCMESGGRRCYTATALGLVANQAVPVCLLPVGWILSSHGKK